MRSSTSKRKNNRQSTKFFNVMPQTGLVAFCFLACISTVTAHSWVEQMYVVASNGTFIGAPGYARGNVQRSVPNFGDGDMVQLIPPNGRSTGNVILPTDLMCKSSQTIGNQTSGSPALTASPGDMVALRYQENGHVTLPQNQPGKPANRGTVYIYGTTKSSNDDKFLSIHNVWNAAGTGGDGRGILLATRNFDDGQCYQINSGTISQTRQKQFPHTAGPPMGADLWCQSDVAIPSTLAASGSYTLYWVWDWPTEPSSTQPLGLNETYTTCMDIAFDTGSGTSNGLSFKQGQDLNSAAIATELSTAFIVAPTGSAAGNANLPTNSGPASQPTSASQPHASSSIPAPEGTPVAGAAYTVTVTKSIPATTVVVTETFIPKTPTPTPIKESGPSLIIPVASSISSGGSSSSLIIQPFLTGPSTKPTIATPPPTTTTPKSSTPAPQSTAYTTLDTVVVITDYVTESPSSMPAAKATAIVASSGVPKIRGRTAKARGEGKGKGEALKTHTHGKTHA